MGNQKFLLNRILIIVLLFFSSWNLSAASPFLPMISMGWDYNLGFTLGGGICIDLEKKRPFQGVFIKFEHSIFQEKGNNLSLGYLRQDAMLFRRLGFNRMNIKKGKYPGNYFGTEFTLNLGLLYIRTGLMYSKHYPTQAPMNFASGLGI